MFMRTRLKAVLFGNTFAARRNGASAMLEDKTVVARSLVGAPLPSVLPRLKIAARSVTGREIRSSAQVISKQS
jgi:hypothetical protein